MKQIKIMKGDKVMDAADSVWGNEIFVVDDVRQFGNLSVALCHSANKPVSKLNRCNLLTQRMRLISSDYRPLVSVGDKVLKKMVSKGNIHAKREFLIRIRNAKEKQHY